MLGLAAQLGCGVQAGKAVFCQELKKVVTFNKVELAWLASFCSRVVRDPETVAFSPNTSLG